MHQDLCPEEHHFHLNGNVLHPGIQNLSSRNENHLGHLLKKMIHDNGEITQHCVRTVHAEQNAICQAAKRGIALEGATVYCKMTPCRTCAMLIINCGIKRVVCEKHYHDEKDSLEMFMQAKIQIEHLEDSVQTYADM